MNFRRLRRGFVSALSQSGHDSFQLLVAIFRRNEDRVRRRNNRDVLEPERHNKRTFAAHVAVRGTLNRGIADDYVGKSFSSTFQMADQLPRSAQSKLTGTRPAWLVFSRTAWSREIAGARLKELACSLKEVQILCQMFQSVATNVQQVGCMTGKLREQHSRRRKYHARVPEMIA